MAIALEQLPIVLLPVTLEVRFKGAELWLRIWPHELHVDALERDLTKEEQDYRKAFLDDVTKGDDAERTAWGKLAGRFGSRRAAWIASDGAAAAAARAPKAAVWTRAPTSRLLP